MCIRDRFCREEKDGRFFTLTPNIRNHVGFQRANLLDGRISQGPFDLIFCRNVMIYFDEESRKKLLNRLYRLLKPGGYLFLGHTELLTKNHEQFQYVYPAVYRKAVEELSLIHIYHPPADQQSAGIGDPRIEP